MLTISDPFSSHVIINIPHLCKSVNMMVDFNATIGDFIDKILGQVGIKEKENYKLFAVSGNFLELPSEALCSSFFFKFYDSLLLLGKNDIQIITTSIYYEDKKTSVSIEGSSEISYLVSLVTRLLRLPISQTYYLMFNPITNEFYPLDSPISANSSIPDFQNKYILKPFSLFTSPYLFSPMKVNENDQEQQYSSFISHELLSLQHLQLRFIPPTFRAILNSVHQYVNLHKDDPENYLTLSLLDKKKMESIMTNYDDEHCFECLSDTEKNSFLFYLLSSYQQSYITNNMANSIIRIFTSSENHVDVFYKVSALIALLPVCSQCILLELCRCFSPISTKHDVAQLISRCFVPEVKSKDLIEFFRFVLVFYEFLFHLGTTNKLCVSKETNELCLMTNDNRVITLNGQITKPPESNLDEFIPNRNVFDVLETLISGNEKVLEDLNVGKFEKMNSKIENVEKLQEQKDELIKQIKQKLNQ